MERSPAGISDGTAGLPENDCRAGTPRGLRRSSLFAQPVLRSPLFRGPVLDVDASIDFSALFQSLTTPHVVLSRNFDIVEMNAAYLEVTRRSREDIIGRNLFDAFPASGESLQMLTDSLTRTRDEGVVDVLALIPYAIPVEDDLEMRYWSATHVPVRNRDGEVTFILQNTQDVTELQRLKAAIGGGPGGDAPGLLGTAVLRRAEALQAVNATLLAERSHLRRLFMEAPGFMCVLSGPDFVFELANRAYLQMVGNRDLVGRPVRDALPEVVAQGFIGLLERVVKTREPFVGRAIPISLQRSPDGPQEERFLDFVYQPVIEADGKVSGIFVEGSDVTEQVRALERQRLLMDELNHRVKNTLATVQAIASQTLSGNRSPEDFSRTFQGRLMALSRTHDVLTASQWEGARLLDLLGKELGVFGEERVAVRAGNPFLPARVSLVLAMVLHELTTNAVRHGALAVDVGHLRVDAGVSLRADGERVLTIEWLEEGGPRVAAATTRRFGSRMIERSVRGELKGDLVMDFRPQGLYCRIILPLGGTA